jgi:hypothetical protein
MKPVHMLSDPWAPHPVVNRNICYGGGGGGGGSEDSWMPGNAPTVPDYSQYISSMTETGNKIKGYGDDLYKWAQDAGVKISGIADTVSGRAGDMADYASGEYKGMMQKWKDTYGDLYQSQADEARKMIGDLGATQEKYAGKYQADVAQAFDASAEAQERELRRYGLKAPGSGAAALNGMVKNQRGLAQVAAGEQGRNVARDEAWKRVGEAQEAGKIMPQLAQQGASTALAAGNQQIGAPESAISTTASAFNPSIQEQNAAYPWMKQWGDTMATGYNQSLAGYNAYNTARSSAEKLKAEKESQEAESGGGGIMGMVGGLAGTVGGSFLGPMGGAVGGALGFKLGGMMGAAEGGAIEPDRMDGGGDHAVTPDMSQSEGAITDDVPARLNVGEFVFPKDVVQWRGEAWMQKEIMKARKEREANTVAEPEMGQMSAIDMQAPQFQSPQQQPEPPL